MGVSFFPRIENAVDDCTFDICGKALASEYKRLNGLIKKQGYRDLMAFYVPHEEEMTRADKDEWYNPMEGIGIIDAMTKTLEERKADFDCYDRLKTDLVKFRMALDMAASHGKRWNLGMDG